jgi:hypothetical protein
VRHPLGSAAGLFSSRWFAIGWMVAVGATRPQRSSLAAMIAVEGAIVAVAAAVLAIPAHHSVLRSAKGLLLGLGAGALFGVSNLAIKFLTHPEARSMGCCARGRSPRSSRARSLSTPPRAASSSGRPSR